MIVNYSFIIPHHNTPDLLNRCLNSIPQREDIEIIVVDDNSDADKKPQVKRPDVKLIYIDAEHTKGAGRARNYGLKEAKGKWLVFADADDFYEKDFMLELDKFKDSDYDIVIWDHYSKYKVSDGTWTYGDTNLYMKALALEPKNELLLKAMRFRVNAPWNKMYNAEFLHQNNFLYEELPVGNDAFFSMSAMDAAKKVGLIFKRLYYWVLTENGLTHGKKKENLILKRIASKADKIKIKNKAWGCIVPFHSGMKSIASKHGLWFAFQHFAMKAVNGTPWLLVYYQRWLFIRTAKRIINKNKG